MVENSVPSRTPWSHGYRSTERAATHSPFASRSESPATPTNQSELGSTCASSVTSGSALVKSTPAAVAEPVAAVPDSVMVG